MNIDEIFASLGNSPAARIKALMARLRDPQSGCPWDVAQTFKTIAPYTIEEAYEVSDAIDQNDMPALREELGDLLLQVIFHAQMANEDGAFNFDDVCDGLVRKMIARHPHVFGDAAARSAGQVKDNWEQQKETERAGKHTSVLDGVAMALPALMRADKLQKRAARVGFDWGDTAPVIDKIAEEAAEVADALAKGEPQARIHEEIGDLIFSLANLARKLGVDPEHALRDTNTKFTRRFRYIEDNAKTPMADIELDAMEVLWIAAKREGL